MVTVQFFVDHLRFKRGAVCELHERDAQAFIAEGVAAPVPQLDEGLVASVAARVTRELRAKALARHLARVAKAAHGRPRATVELQTRIGSLV